MARIFTAFIQTGSVVGTIAINAAFRFRFQDIRLFFGPAGYQWIANPSWRTHTFSIMIFDSTSGGWRARVIIQAWVNTSVGDTGGIRGTIRIDATFNADTLHIGISF